jgi:calcineurin-like phosphoesterase family protein
MSFITTRPAGAIVVLALLAGCHDQTTEPDRTPPDGAAPVPDAASALAAAPVTVVAAGDIAGCGSANRDEATAKLVHRIGGTVLVLGDNAYPDGTAADYRCYNASWGRFKSRTRPTPGNHEYHTAGAAPYFSYFGSRAGPAGKGYYSFNLGSWHIVSLNSEGNILTQAKWLKADLAANKTKCTLAYWHRPTFTSGAVHGPFLPMRLLFGILYQAGADVVLSGHNHQYERFAPQNPIGRADPSRGITQFVVGTGGFHSLYNFTSPKPNSQVRYKGWGVLKLDLRAGRYSYTFVPVSGRFRDKGTRRCH